MLKSTDLMVEPSIKNHSFASRTGDYVSNDALVKSQTFRNLDGQTPTNPPWVLTPIK